MIEHFKGDGWNITVHERGSTSESRPFGVFEDLERYQYRYQYNADFQSWWTDWTVNGVRVKEWWRKYNITKNMLVPLPDELKHLGVKGYLNLSDEPGKIEPCSIPPGLTDDEPVAKAFFGPVYEFLLERRPVKVPEGYKEGQE